MYWFSLLSDHRLQYMCLMISVVFFLSFFFPFPNFFSVFLSSSFFWYNAKANCDLIVQLPQICMVWKQLKLHSNHLFFWPWHGNSISSCCLLVYLFVRLFFSKYLHIPHCPSIHLLINSTRQIVKYTWMNGLSPERKRNQNTTRRVAFILWFGMLCFTFLFYEDEFYLRFCFCHCKYIVINK